MRRVCVYAGAYPGERDAYVQAAAGLARALARRGIGLVYGGGGVGLMGALADASVDAGGEVIGVIPEALMRREEAHRGVSDLRVVRSMHERKALMAGLADAFIAAPGGIGTLEELVEAWTWTQLGLHAKPVALLNVAGYYDRLVAFLDHAVREGFLPAPHHETLVVSADPAALLDALALARPQPAERLLEPGTT